MPLIIFENYYVIYETFFWKLTVCAVYNRILLLENVIKDNNTQTKCLLRVQLADNAGSN